MIFSVGGAACGSWGCAKGTTANARRATTSHWHAVFVENIVLQGFHVIHFILVQVQRSLSFIALSGVSFEHPLPNSWHPSPDSL